MAEGERTGMDRNRRFWNGTAGKYSRQPIADEAAYRHKLEKTREFLTPQSNVLEFGCGTGSTAILHAPHVRHILATDMSDEMIRIARERAAEAGVENLTFRRSGFDELDCAPESFDAVLGMSILHLLDDHAPAIARIRELLKPGGVFISSTVCLGDRMWFMIPIIPIARLVGLFPLVRVFTRDALRRSVRDAGFEIEYDWQPEKSQVLFLVARKPGR